MTARSKSPITPKRAVLRGGLVVLLGVGLANSPLLFPGFSANTLISGAAEASGVLVAIAGVVVIVFGLIGSG